MTGKKRFILSVDQNQLVLPEALISENITAFVCERFEDGRIVLSPLPASPKDALTVSENKNLNQDPRPFPNVINFGESRRRLKNQSRKNKKTAKVTKAQEAQSEQQEVPEVVSRFVKLCLFSSRLEAEMLGEILKQAEIPYLIQSEDIGIFGPGAAPVPGGVRIVVRKADLEYAKTSLAGLI